MTAPVSYDTEPLQRKSLSAKLIAAVHGARSTATVQQPSPGQENEIEVDPNDPRLQSLSRTGSFQVVEGGVRVSHRMEKIEVPSMWVTTDDGDES